MMDERTKSRMRTALDAYVDLHELPKPIAARTPIRSPFFSYNAFSGVLAFVLILLVGGGGAAYAAEGSVPGSPLYPVKVSVIEPVQGALITSAQGQASWHASLASRRLDEATTLAAANKLDSSKQEYLQTKFNTEVDASSQNADALAATGKADAALDARSDLEARMTAHAEILAVITNHLETTATSTDPTLRGTKALLASVEQRRQEVTDARLALEDGTASSSSAAAVATLARAEVTTGAVASEAKAQDDSSVAPVALHISAAKTALRKARQAKIDSAQALNDSHAAERSSEIASILLQHASLLRAFAPAATTTASTTATTTESKSEKVPASTDDKQDFDIDN